jgi:tetratricopeptide (TPR) repeat protein
MNKAVTLLNQLSTSAPANPEYQHLLALCYLEGAPVDDGDGGEARAGDERGIEILEALVKAFPGIPDYAYDLSEACARMHIPEPRVPPEIEETVEQRFSRALVLIEELVLKHPDVPDFLASHARLQLKLVSFYGQVERWADAEHTFRQAIALQARLVNAFPDSPYYAVWMATFRIALADALIRRDQPGEASTELQGTVAALLLQLKQRPTMNSLHDLLAWAYAQLELALRQAGESAQADEAGRDAEQYRTMALPRP